MMILRTILQNSTKPQYSNTLLNIIRISYQNKQMSYSLQLPFKHYVHGNYNFQFVSSCFNYISHQFDLKFSHAVTTNEVQSLCDFILTQNSENWETERIEEFKKVLSFLLSNGYSSKDVKEKFLTYLNSSDCSYTKIRLLACIDSDIFLLLPLLSLPVTLLKTAARKAKTEKPCTKEFSNRISYLSHHLELEPFQLIPALAKHSALLTMKFNRLDIKMNILKKANISPKYIVQDLWIFNYNEQLLANRVQAAAKAGVELKPWMLRCSETFFESILMKHSEKQRILSGETLHSYLAKKLDCSTEYINYMMAKNKLLHTINIPKLEQVINFLYEKGYTAEEIRLFPRVFCSSVLTLEKRFENFQHLRSTLPTLGQLCMSSKRVQSMTNQKKTQILQ